MAEGVVHEFDADHGVGMIRGGRDGELLPFQAESVSREHRADLDRGVPVRFDVAMGRAGKQAVRVTPV